MTLFAIVLAILFALVLSGAAVSVFALQRAHRLLRDIERRRLEQPQPPPAVEPSQELHDAVAGLAAQVHDLQRTPGVAPIDPALPRPCLNLSKRSQALRLHRRGESPEKIAAELQLPRQEVDLLLKVHRIVLSTV
jgi:hypothetical protein